MSVHFPEVGEEGIDFRVVLVKTYRSYRRKKGKRKKVLIYPLCTNLFDWKAKSIVKPIEEDRLLRTVFGTPTKLSTLTSCPAAAFMVIKPSCGLSYWHTTNSFFFKSFLRVRKLQRLTPKKLSQKYLKRAGEIKFLKTLLQLEISRDEKEEQTLKKIVNSVN